MVSYDSSVLKQDFALPVKYEVGRKMEGFALKALPILRRR